MDEARPRRRSSTVAQLAPHTRADLVRYFAWGYLSRRELNERLKRTTRRQPHASAA